MRKAQATTSPSSCSTSWHSARAVPPVANRSSWTSTRAPAATASEWTSSASVAYSSTYSARTVSCGSLPGLRASTNPAPSSRATAGPARKPRAGAAGDRRPEQEAARLGPDDDVDAQVAREIRQPGHGRVEPLRRGEDGRDVLEDDARLREVRDVAQERVEVDRHGRALRRRSCAGRG